MMNQVDPTTYANFCRKLHEFCPDIKITLERKPGAFIESRIIGGIILSSWKFDSSESIYKIDESTFNLLAKE